MSFLPATLEADYELIMSPYEANNLVTEDFYMFWCFITILYFVIVFLLIFRLAKIYVHVFLRGFLNRWVIWM